MDEKIYTRNRLRFGGFNSNNSKQYKNQIKLIKIITILVIASLIVYFSLKSIEPIMETQCMVMAKNIATKISNDEATKVMAKYNYNDIIDITKDEQGNVKMVSTNMITINEIISDIPVKMQEEMKKGENNNFTIRLGSLLGNKFLAGRGPKVNMKMEFAGTVDTDLKSEFEDAGINQTLHKIYLEVKCNVIILTPIQTIEKQITNQVLLAAGIIVGDIPETYYNLEGMTQDDAMEVM